MLFEIDQAVVESALGAPHVRSAIENLLISYSEGKHVPLLTARKDLIAKLELSPKARGAALRSLARTSEYKGLRDTLSLTARLTDRDDLGKATVGGRTILEVPASLAADSSFTQASVLLAENLARDCRVYCALAQALCVRRRWNLEPSFELRGGGGTATCETLGATADQGRVCICILDSDRRRPEGKLGQTALAALGVPVTDIQRVEVLFCRELENLFVFSDLAKVLASTQSPLLGKVAMLESIGGSANLDTLDFVDLEVGVRGFDIVRDDYLRTLTNRLNLQVPKCCREEQKCGDRVSCTCVLVPALGKSLLHEITRAIELASKQKISEYFSSTLEDGE